MSREEALKRRYELEEQLRNIIAKSSGLSNRLAEISKELSGIDAKIELLNQKKSDLSPQQRSDKLEIYIYAGIVLLILALVDFILLCSNSLSKYKLIFTGVIILIICIGLWCGYQYWVNSVKLKQDIELEEEIKQIKSGIDTLFDNRANIQADLEILAFNMSEIIMELKKLKKVK